MHTLSYWGLKCQLECAESDLNVPEFTVIWVHCVNRVHYSSVKADFNTRFLQSTSLCFYFGISVFFVVLYKRPKSFHGTAKSSTV